MKKTIIYLFVIIIILSSGLGTITAYAVSEEPSVLILSGNNTENNEIEIYVDLQRNTGIISMLLSLEYDTEAMTLTNAVKGKALSSLSGDMTNTETEKGFGIYPFSFIYDGEANDLSVGRLLTLTFKLKDGIKDGNYNISLRYNKGTDSIYDNGSEFASKTLLIDSASIKIEGNSVKKIKIIKSDALGSEDNNIVWICVAVIVSVVAIAAVITVLVIRNNKNGKDWVKL